MAADEYGGLIGLLADTPSDAYIPDVDFLEPVMSHPWAGSTLDALTRSGTLRQAARLAGVHHSTAMRVDAIGGMMDFDPLDGLGRTRLGIAYLVWAVATLEGPRPPSTNREASQVGHGSGVAEIGRLINSTDNRAETSVRAVAARDGGRVAGRRPSPAGSILVRPERLRKLLELT